MRRTTRTAEDLRALAAVARGDAPADLTLEGGRVLNVYSGELLDANVAVARGRIAYVGARRAAAGAETSVIPLEGRILVPGYIDPHAHPAGFSNPVALAEAVLALGTTAIVLDTLHLLLHARADRLPEFLTVLSALPLHYYWFLRLHGQGHEDREQELFAPDRLSGLLRLESVRAVGEMTRWPALYAGEAAATAAVAAGLAEGRRVEGHAPGVSAERLQTLTAAGISSDHEAITADEALARLRAGLYVMLRHSSIRRDLPRLASIATGERAFSGRLMLTPDGPNPVFIDEEGYVDRLIAVAIEAGVPPMAAYQMATINPATYYGLDEEIGGIAPGRLADINVISDLRHPRPEIVFAGGRLAAEAGSLTAPLPHLDWARYLPPAYAPSWQPRPELFRPPEGESVPAMHLENEVITRRREVRSSGGSLPPGIQQIALLDAEGRWISRGLLSGFAERLDGLASTFSVVRAVTVIGAAPQAMARAARRVLEMGGGVALVEDKRLVYDFALPLAGTMSQESFPTVVSAVRTLTALLRERGYPHGDLLYTLLFLSFDALPDLRLTSRGLWDVKRQRVLLPGEDLRS
ncbi:MAG TPA: adenine deaminase C-terminal domain-containing protein [bacterium]|jgi:adenine deaminase|nr:adenine deaminase C-terminal domain-containing protein [bacterium]